MKDKTNVKTGIEKKPSTERKEQHTPKPLTTPPSVKKGAKPIPPPPLKK